jgi:hypothetical protein
MAALSIVYRTFVEIKFCRYTASNLAGNIAVKSTRQVYVSYFGTNNAATYEVITWI